MGSKAAEKPKLGVFSETVLPWPVAATPFTVAEMSEPVAFVALSDVPNVPPVPSLTTFTEAVAAEP